MAQNGDRRVVLTPPFRVSFPSLFKATSYEGGEPKYSVVAIFDKKMDDAQKKLYADMAAIAREAAEAKWGKNLPKNLRSPFRDGTEKDMEGYGPGVVFCTLSSKMPPGVIGRNKERLAEADVYAGCFARATVVAYAYDQRGNRGVAFGLNNLQKLGEGPRFSQVSDPDKDFDSVDDETFKDDYAASPEGGAGLFD
jgi:hypothetical protein